MTDLDRGFAAGWHDEQYANRHRRMPPDYEAPAMIAQAEADAKAQRAFGRGICAGIMGLSAVMIGAGWLL